MDELVAWLGVQLDEDERIVQEALRYVDADWRRDAEGNIAVASGMTAAGPQSVAITADRWKRPMLDSPGVVAHVAEWDPARVLREISAKRRTLIRCEESMLSANPMLVHFAKQTVWEMALPYADRPGYRDDWRP